MLRARATRKISLWLATLALLAGCVAPLLSQLLAPAQTPARAATVIEAISAEVCTALGAQNRRAGDGDPGPAHDAAFQHCPYCALHLPALGPPPAPLLALAPALAAPATLAARQIAPYSARIWVRAPPRAPPSTC